MTDIILPEKEEIAEIIDLLADEAKKYMETLDEIPVRRQGVKEILKTFEMPFPETGKGTERTLNKLLTDGIVASVASAGPRFFHFVVGGITPAAFGAEWLQVVLDQIAYAYVTSPLAVNLERISLGWLQEIFEIPANWGGIMTTGGTMAMYIGLAAAREWYGEQNGISVYEEGIADLGQIPIFASDILHASGVKVLAMLGIGSNAIQRLPDDKYGVMDLEKLENELRQLDGKPSIIVAVAGEPNAGLFDPIPKIVELAEKHNAWLHIDGAFGLFAKILPETKELLEHSARAKSISVDGHKWLNVPYDCGMGFVHDPKYMRMAFRYSADYLAETDDEEFVFGVYGPESSRRGRSLAVWSTLHAYGKSGLRHLIRRNVEQARYLFELVETSDSFEALAEPVINVVCFRFNPGNHSETELDSINTKLGEAILDDGRVYLGTTRFDGKVALRPAMVNWRTERSDIKFMFTVIEELVSAIDNTSS